MADKGIPAGDVQSVHRALNLLETIGMRGEVGVSEVSRDLGLHVSTTHNLLRTLARRHYLMTADGRYSLGPAAVALGAQWQPGATLGAYVQPVTDAISAQCRQSVTATILVGTEGRKVGFSAGPGPVTIATPTWAWSNPLRLPTSRLLVAMTLQHDWKQIVDEFGKDANSSLSRKKWLELLASDAERGFIESFAATPASAAAMAVPVWGSGTRPLISLAASTFGTMATPEVWLEMRDALWAGTTRLSATLGCNELPQDPPQVRPEGGLLTKS